MRKYLTIGFVLLLLFSLTAYAKGGSSGGSVTSKKTIEVAAPQPPNCEEFSLSKQRIECRLQYGQQEETVPEPCRVANDQKDACIKYYKDALPCYELNGREKDRCFKEKSGITKSKGKLELRYYILALLYDLEEKVEDAQKEGKLSVQTAAELIDDIVTIKIKVLTNKSKEDLLKSLNNLKQKWPKSIS